MKLTEEQIEKLRQSGIRLDADGRFWHEGAEIKHEGMRAAFFRWLDRNPDGRWVLRLDENRFVYLDVDDAPFVIRSLRWEGDRAFVHLSDGTEEELAYDTLRVEGDKPHARVKGRFDARIGTGAWGAMEARLVEDRGRIFLDAAGGRHEVKVG